MSWLLVMILIVEGVPKLVVTPRISKETCERTVQNIRTTRPNAVYAYECVDLQPFIGLGL